MRMPPTPVCPYCGKIPPSGEEARYQWNGAHLHSRGHRWWWTLKKIFKRGK